MPEQLIPTSPFDFRQMLRRPLSRPSKVTVIDATAGSFTRVIRLGTRLVPVTVVDEGTVDQPMLRLIYPEGLTESEGAEVRERLARMFSTNVNLQGFYSRMETQAGWGGLIKQLYGLRAIQDADLFESMVKVIVGQQLNVQFAATLVERLVDLGGEVVDWHSTSLPVFPSAERVADWSYEDLRALSFSQRKAEYVIDFARAVVNGRIGLDELWSKSDAEIYDTLMPLRGVGRWTVECFLLFGMGRPDVMPAADIGVQNAIQKLYGLEHRPKEDEVRQLSEPWAPWRSYATYYLWQSLIRVV
ncbi:DNA-3-methyladenine glycosylase family protein [Alicyclobacillus sp. ALC3]|uniref:DNA-3-methyladenine glycosylase family protein n=1 Tax=Alicyclobacillus sp. ALC3 TaxID=2796143 RepID=UPI002378FB17|nr:DNA-3-methyladenine glycosylase [Alicyclobacillus sp. ALC3]WDL98539.1 DNA-3-methyladenine glycosylase 2 family protein [Alicyclobacillus sp. ALC3]